MLLTLEQIKKDVEEGKSKAIYYSAGTLWWTHLDKDVEEATKQGRKVQKERFLATLNDPSVSEETKNNLKALKNMLGNDSPPLDPTGCPLFMRVEKSQIDEWFTVAEAKPMHFGSEGLDSFVMAHHQNCQNKVFDNWEDYGRMVRIYRNTNTN